MEAMLVHRTRRIAAFLLAFTAFIAPARADAQTPAREPGSELTVYLATMGQGDEVWEKFGHNAIWIRDAQTGTTIAYSYGAFYFAQERFITRLMTGRMLYSMNVDDAENEIAAYSYYNRSITTQRLNLTPAQKHSLREFLEWNWLPQNRDYLYDYFRDNCSTRVRDALDRVLGGAIRRTLAGVPTGTTFRSHSLRLTAAAPFTYSGIMLGLGLPADAPIDAWQEAFVPMELARHLRSVQVPDRSGAMVPLVAEETPVFVAERAEPAQEAPNRFVIFLFAGLIVGVSLLIVAERARTGRFASAGLALAIFFWGLVTGFFGLLLALLWLFTDHTATYPNTSLLQVNPLGLLLAVAGPLAVVGSRTSALARAARWVAIGLAVLSAAGAALLAVPLLRQGNAPIIALVLPIHLAVVAVLYRMRSRAPSSATDMEARVPAPAAA
jgi:hypothetical protein